MTDDSRRSLLGVLSWHRHKAATAQRRSRDRRASRASRFTRDDYEKERDMHQHMADVLANVLDTWTPK